MSGVAVASSSQLAADVGAEVARAGGNAIDTAIAAALTVADRLCGCQLW
jgi:gamma-glutamyltranspeptidase